MESISTIFVLGFFGAVGLTMGLFVVIVAFLGIVRIVFWIDNLRNRYDNPYFNEFTEDQLDESDIEVFSLDELKEAELRADKIIDREGE